MAIYTNDPDLEGLWRLNSDLTDESANGNDLTDNNTVGYNTGDYQEGTASLDLERDNSEYASITDGAQVGLDLSGNFSIGGWVKVESYVDNMPVAGKGNPGGVNLAYLLDFNLNTGEYRLRGLFSTDGTYQSGNAIEVGAGEDFPTGEWHHVVFVRNGANLYLYIDGAEAETKSGASTSAVYNSADEFTLGESAGVYYDGLMDEQFVFSRALILSEVQDIYNNGIQDPAGGSAVPIMMNSYRRRRD